VTRHGDEAHCDICGESPAVFSLGSPHADWGYFALLCQRHNTLWQRSKARVQWAWAKWTP
jgi:hypothetical protein